MKMTNDLINDEIRAIRRELAAKCDNDLTKIFADARQRELNDGHTYITLPPRRVETAPEEIHERISPSGQLRQS
jgi:adenylate kinase